jgi:tetratricopeptide (TPR) repeat protein
MAMTAGGIVFGDRLASSSRDEREAVRLTNQAIGEMRNGGVQNYAAARGFLDRAAALRPNLALTLAATAELAARAGSGSFEGAAALAAEALRLEPGCGECRAIRGYIEMTRFWNWESAKAELDRATAAPRASQQAHLWYGQLLLITNRIEDGMRQLDVAIAKDPAKPGPYVMKGVGHYLAMRYDQALHDLEKAEGLNPHGPNPHFWMYRAFLLKGVLADAAKERAIHFAKFSGHSIDEEARLRRQSTAVAVNEGKAGIVRFWLGDSATPNAKRLHGYERAIWKTYAGHIEEALDELEGAEKNRPFNLIYVAVDPALAPLRKEPRFRAVVSRLKLPAVE